MQPAGAPPVVAQPGGGVLGTIDAFYCRAGNGGMAFNALPFCDIAIAPGPLDAHFLFTTGMNGCSLVVASAVPIGAAPLAHGAWRVMHDHDHRSIAQWQAAGYTIRFAAYADLADAGVGPFLPVNVVSYNPNNYPWNYMDSVRIVTNFLHWTGVNWNFNSRHYHAAGKHIINVDSPPGVIPAVASTQTLAI
ncbi:hypothetical protein [Inconstantimicrobium mannanitabidum]|uniref:hypothetical protein n=1 Tax=Inconstantimicrobium mannanitabidum TaxID=1604901 RepID=UPI0021C277FB|nr:hypothetical protein [Clostridium sp. TW13]